MEYRGRKLVGYSCEQIFDVVSDVQNYKHILPFWRKSTIILENDNYLEASVELGFRPLLEICTAKVSLQKPNLVETVFTDGKFFDHLILTWKFSPGLEDNLHSSIVDFTIDLEFKPIVHSKLAHVFFYILVTEMEEAVFREGKKRYGPPTVRMQYLVG